MAITHRRLNLLTFPEENVSDLRGLRVYAVIAHVKNTFFRLPYRRFQATGHKAQKIRVTGYLMWDDDHNGSADIGSTIQYFGTNEFHHPWRSTAWEIHPIIKIEVTE